VKPILSAKNIVKIFHTPRKVEVLAGVSLEVFPGQTVAITGKSGEGKSTLLHILGTLEQPCSGEVEICGQTWSDLCLVRNQYLGFIFQTFNLLEDYTVFENVTMPAKIGRTPYTHALHLLEEVGLKERANFPAKLLSGGEKQRAAIARAFCNDPQIILADEPSGNLDHHHSAAIHELLLGSCKKQGKALVIVTHDLELAAMCDTTYLLKDGSLTCVS
jgi:lipoprotein-releasing system ATP-binding protein